MMTVHTSHYYSLQMAKCGRRRWSWRSGLEMTLTFAWPFFWHYQALCHSTFFFFDFSLCLAFSRGLIGSRAVAVVMFMDIREGKREREREKVLGKDGRSEVRKESLGYFLSHRWSTCFENEFSLLSVMSLWDLGLDLVIFHLKTAWLICPWVKVWSSISITMLKPIEVWVSLSLSLCIPSLIPHCSSFFPLFVVVFLSTSVAGSAQNLIVHVYTVGGNNKVSCGRWLVDVHDWKKTCVPLTRVGWLDVRPLSPFSHSPLFLIRLK